MTLYALTTFFILSFTSMLPSLPVVLSRAGQPFMRSTLPLLLGIAVTLAVLTSLAMAGGSTFGAASNYGRIAALVFVAGFGLLLLFPALDVGKRLSSIAGPGTSGSAPGSFIIGVAAAFLWAPCAAPLFAAFAALSALALTIYAAGAAAALAAALLLGARVLAAFKGSRSASEWIRRGLGVAVLAATAVIAAGLDQRLLTQLGQSMR